MTAYVFPDIPENAEVTYQSAPVNAYFVNGHSLSWKLPTDGTSYNQKEARHWAAQKTGRREHCCVKELWNTQWCGEFKERFGIAPE